MYLLMKLVNIDLYRILYLNLAYNNKLKSLYFPSMFVRNRNSLLTAQQTTAILRIQDLWEDDSRKLYYIPVLTQCGQLVQAE